MADTHAKYLERDNNQRVCARVFCVKDNDVLVIKRFSNGEDFAVLPGGGVDSGEDLKNAAARECLEETGITVKITEEVYVEKARAGFPQTHYFAASYISGEAGLDPESEEFKRSSPGINSYEPAWIKLSDSGLLLKPVGILAALASD